MSKKRAVLLVAAARPFPGEAGAEAPPPTPAPPPLPYGAPIGLDDAKKAAAAAVEEVKKIGAAPNAIAIVDHGGFLVYFRRNDNTPLGSRWIGLDKARSAHPFRRPSEVFWCVPH